MYISDRGIGRLMLLAVPAAVDGKEIGRVASVAGEGILVGVFLLGEAFHNSDMVG